MKERPILMNGDMVRAVLAGKKTQTRRIIKPQPPIYIDELHGHELRNRAPYDLEHNETGHVIGWGFQDDNDVFYKCPFRVGMRLWVRETWFPYTGFGCFTRTAKVREGCCIVGYKADMKDGFEACYRPSIHMPRWASRITLEITDVRVQRAKEITQEDAQAEGVEPGCRTCGENCAYIGGCGQCLPDYRDSFAGLWQSIYGSDSWHANPWVWAITFKRIDQ